MKFFSGLLRRMRRRRDSASRGDLEAEFRQVVKEAENDPDAVRAILHPKALAELNDDEIRDYTRKFRELAQHRADFDRLYEQVRSETLRAVDEAMDRILKEYGVRDDPTSEEK